MTEIFFSHLWEKTICYLQLHAGSLPLHYVFKDHRIWRVCTNASYLILRVFKIMQTKNNITILESMKVCADATLWNEVWVIIFSWVVWLLSMWRHHLLPVNCLRLNYGYTESNDCWSLYRKLIIQILFIFASVQNYCFRACFHLFSLLQVLMNHGCEV